MNTTQRGDVKGVKQRAYARLTVKAMDDEKRIITGVATTPTPDRMGDIVEPMGVKFTNPTPLLHQHDSARPVGQVTFDKPTKDGVDFSAEFARVAEPGPLKDRIETAWNEVKLGLVRGVSIGFRPIEFSFIQDGGIRFVETEILELSLVTIPANVEATISTIKSFDRRPPAASGNERRKAFAVPLLPASRGSNVRIVTPKEGDRK